EAILDPPFQSSYSLQLFADAGWQVQSIRIETKRHEGNGFMEAKRESQNVVLTTDLPFLSKATTSETITDDRILGATMLAARIPLFKLIKEGQNTLRTRELDLASIFNTGFDLKDADWKVTKTTQGYSL